MPPFKGGSSSVIQKQACFGYRNKRLSITDAFINENTKMSALRR